MKKQRQNPQWTLMAGIDSKTQLSCRHLNSEPRFCSCSQCFLMIFFFFCLVFWNLKDFDEKLYIYWSYIKEPILWFWRDLVPSWILTLDLDQFQTWTLDKKRLKLISFLGHDPRYKYYSFWSDLDPDLDLDPGSRCISDTCMQTLTGGRWTCALYRVLFLVGH